MDYVSLHNELSNTLLNINNQINTVMSEAREKQIDVHQMKYSDGKHVLIDLLMAKAQCLNGMAIMMREN